MTRPELLLSVAAKSGITPTQAEAVLKVFSEALTEDLASGGTTVLRGFGTFKTARRAERVCRSPRTGEPVDVPAGTAVKFAAAAALKSKANG